jgi:multimeric flavodoxin WrbA
MKVLGVNGSPRASGSTAFALQRALEVIEAQGIDVETVSLAQRRMTPCDGCFACRNGACRHEDDMAPLYDALRSCDGLLLASPVYMGLVTGQMKVFMDRTVVFRATGEFELSGKVGAGISCGGFRNGGQELTLQCMHTFFLQQDMFAVSDGPRFSHLGAAIAGRAQDDDLGMTTVENVALRLAVAVMRMAAS